jgi:hypothetical protein
MATSDILGLFVSPEQYQAQQLAQQQANEQTRAINFANLDPRQQANYGTFLGAQQLGRGFAGLLGVQDPQLQRIRQRDQLMQSINPADPESLMAGIRAATNAGDQELALTLTDFMNKQGSEMALAQQRKAAADKERVQSQSGGIQEAARINAITTELATLDPDNPDQKSKYDALVAERTRLERQGRVKAGDKFTQLQDLYAQRKLAVDAGNEQDVQIVDRLINSLAPEKGGDKGFESIVRSERIGTLTNELETLEAENKKDTPEYRRKAAQLKSLQGGTGGKEFESLVLADTIVGLRKQIREAKDLTSPEVLEAKDRLAVLEQQLKKENPDLKIVGEIRSGADKGKTVYVDAVKNQQFVFSQNSKGEQVRKLVSDVDVDRMTSQVTATATSAAAKAETKLVEGIALLDVDDLKTARANKRAASASNDSLRNLLALDDSGLIGGAFATNRVGVANLLNTLGVLSKADSTNLSNSQQYQKIGADLIFNALQGKLGTGVSNADRDFIKEIFPQLETSATARRRLIKYLADKNNKLIEEADSFEAWIRKNKTAEGYKSSNSGAFHVPGTKLDLSKMSNSELDAAIKAKKGK